jgi:hypothetical protein
VPCAFLTYTYSLTDITERRTLNRQEVLSIEQGLAKYDHDNPTDLVLRQLVKPHAIAGQVPSVGDAEYNAAEHANASVQRTLPVQSRHFAQPQVPTHQHQHLSLPQTLQHPILQHPILQQQQMPQQTLAPTLTPAQDEFAMLPPPPPPPMHHQLYQQPFTPTPMPVAFAHPQMHPGSHPPQPLAMHHQHQQRPQQPLPSTIQHPFLPQQPFTPMPTQGGFAQYQALGGSHTPIVLPPLFYPSDSPRSSTPVVSSLSSGPLADDLLAPRPLRLVSSTIASPAMSSTFHRPSPSRMSTTTSRLATPAYSESHLRTPIVPSGHGMRPQFPPSVSSQLIGNDMFASLGHDLGMTGMLILPRVSDSKH